MSVSRGLAQPYIPCKHGDRPGGQGRPVESTSNSIGSPIQQQSTIGQPPRHQYPTHNHGAKVIIS